MIEKTTAVKKHLGKLFIKGLSLSHPLYLLQIMREKLEQRELQDFDKQDIMGELGSLQYTLRELDSEMLKIHDLLKQ